MPTLYHIKPKNDGYHILGRSMTGEYFLISKNSKNIGWRGELIFKNEKEAQEYIDTHNLTEDYAPEKFWRLEQDYKAPDIIEEARMMFAKANITIKRPIYCPDCGSELRCMATVGIDESDSGFAETLYQCTNEECMKDFSVARDYEGNFINMLRHFWG